MQGNSGKSRATDPRPGRTRQAIYAAAEEVAQSDDQALTVKNVAAAAGVSRSSFYAQFDDLDDLALSIFVDALRDIGLDDYEGRLSGKDIRQLAHRNITRAFEHIATRRRLYRAVFSGSNGPRVQNIILDVCSQQALMAMQPVRLPAATTSDEDLARFLAGGAFTLLRDWLLAEKMTSPADITHRTLALLPSWLIGEEIGEEDVWARSGGPDAKKPT